MPAVAVKLIGYTPVCKRDDVSYAKEAVAPPETMAEQPAVLQVSPAGAEATMVTGKLKPLIGVIAAVKSGVELPAWTEAALGNTLKVKSCAGAIVTTRLAATLRDRPPPVPLKGTL